MTSFLGLDAGGTHTRLALLGAEGRVLERAELGPVQLRTQGVPRAAARLREGLDRLEMAGGAPSRAVLGIAGAGEPRLREGLARALALPFAFDLVGDTVVAAAAALRDGPGVGLWSGTGSFAIARGEDGTLSRCGGRGSKISDEGSAQAIVREAARAVSRAGDGLGAGTALTEALLSRFEVARSEELGARLQDLGAGELAAALPVVLVVAEAGDETATEILHRAAAQLVELALAAAKKAGLEPERCPLTLGGGAFELRGPLRAMVEARALAAGFAAPRRSPCEGAVAAAHLARELHRGTRPFLDWVRDGGPA